MHEMSYVIKLVNLAAQTAKKENFSRITAIYADIGKMTGVLPYYMQKYYKQAVKGSMLENSALIISETEVKAECGGCGLEYTPDAAHDYLCPECGSGNCKITAGREVLLRKVVFE